MSLDRRPLTPGPPLYLVGSLVTSVDWPFAFTLALTHLKIADWTSLGVALATFLLALTTGYMAWKTKALADQAREESGAVRKQADAVVQQAKASERQAEISAAALEASIQPWLTRVDPPAVISVGEDPFGFRLPLLVDVLEQSEVGLGTIKVRLDLRNVGAGLALIQAVDHYRDRFIIEGRDASGATVTRFGFAASPAVPPGGETRLSFLVKQVSVKHFLGQDQGDGLFFVNVPYTDTKGGQLVDARFHITFSKASDMWLVYRIEYRRDGEARPFVTVESDAAMWG